MNKQTLFLRLPLQEQILFAVRLSLLIRAGIPILQCMRIIRDQTNSKSARYIYTALSTEVEQGGYLHKAVAKFRNIFGDFAINVIQVGEFSGTLHENLHYLGEELKKKQALRRKVAGSLIYPAIVSMAVLAIALLLTVYVFPKIMPVFKSLNFNLPLTTRILIIISSTLIHYWWLVLLAVILSGLILLFLLKIPRVKLWFDYTILYIPGIGALLKSYNLSNINRTLGLLLKSSVPIVSAMQITGETIVNTAYRKHLLTTLSDMSAGGTISVQLARNKKLFPSIMIQMISAGESSGNLSQSLFFLADMYELEVDDKSKNLSTIVEPILLVAVGLLVGFIAISIITPIYEVTQHIQAK